MGHSGIFCVIDSLFLKTQVLYERDGVQGQEGVKGTSAALYGARCVWYILYICVDFHVMGR